MYFTASISTSLAILIVLSTDVTAQNILLNPGFEDNPPSSNGNNIGHSVSPWNLGSGDRSNVVKVDGPAGYNYGTNGPESDASGAPAGQDQHYLDIADGSNDFWQSFTPDCDGVVTYGGYFSTRANRNGRGSISLRNGKNPTDPEIGATTPVDLRGQTSKTDPWTLVQDTATLTAGQTVTFVVTMDNQLNFDEGFVTFEKQCAQPVKCEASEHEYDIKMICGKQRNEEYPENLTILPGTYSTVVNIQNQSEEKGEICKTFHLASPLGTQEPGEILAISSHKIDERAFAVDCLDLAKRNEYLDGILGNDEFFEGFLKLRSSRPLSISSVYTAQDLEMRSAPNIHIENGINSLR